MYARRRRRKLRRLLVALGMVLAFCSGFLGHSLLSARAQESGAQADRRYTSVRVESGDTLWAIAGNYAEAGGCSRGEYIEELRRVNGLSDDSIHAGGYLTIFYNAE